MTKSMQEKFVMMTLKLMSCTAVANTGNGQTMKTKSVRDLAKVGGPPIFLWHIVFDVVHIVTSFIMVFVKSGIRMSHCHTLYHGVCKVWHHLHNVNQDTITICHNPS